MARITENGNPFAALVTFDYDDLGRRSVLRRANGVNTVYSYDNASRLSQLVHDTAGTSHDLTLSFSYNPASQIVSNTRSNDTYAWTGHGSGSTASAANGLNQLTSLGSSSISHDAKGNVTSDPTTGYTFGYSVENLLTTVNAPTWSRTLTYDPLLRLHQAAATQFLHDGEERIAEYAYGSQSNRFVHGPGDDEPLVEYSGTNMSTVRWLHADERGSIIGNSDSAGNMVQFGRYDEYGKIQSYASRFVFAGQPVESVAQLNYARARMYNPRLGRFMQPDPIGYEDGPNLYAYVGNDPVNFMDSDGQHRSPTILRLVVPGQVAWDNAVTAFQKGRYGESAAHAAAMVGEQVLSVATLGRSSAFFQGRVATATLQGEKSLVGQSFGKLGTVVEAKGGQIRGLTPHARESLAAARGGLTERVMRATVRNPTVVLSQSGGKTLYISEKAAVAVDSRGIVVTTYGKKEFDEAIRRILEAVDR